MKRIVPLIVLAALLVTVFLGGMSASSAYAFDPPWPAGIPWPTTVPWPTANPLKIGVPWSPSYQSYPVYVATPVPPPAAPIVAAPSSLPPVVVSSSVPAPSPLPPAVMSSSVPVPSPLPPVVVSSSLPAPVSPVTQPSSNPAPVNVALPVADSSGGLTRDGALIPGDTWRTLGAGASVWYRIGSSGDHMDVWLDATLHTGVGMAIYAPNNSDQPIGRGTPYNADPTRLVWSGGHWNGDGYWYALITNSNPVPVQYRVTSTQQDISNKSCYSYWEWLPTGLYVDWTKCQ